MLFSVSLLFLSSFISSKNGIMLETFEYPDKDNIPIKLYLYVFIY